MMTVLKPGVTDYATPNDTDIVVTRVLKAPRALVFDAWTSPKHLPNWMTGPDGWTMPVCEVDLKPGGAWRYVWRKDDGAEMSMSGFFREVSPPDRVVSTESWGPEWPETLNTVVFTESAGYTTATLTMHFASKETRDAALKTGMKEGMDMGFARLDTLLAAA
ncbi:MAG TPA: SRPBCC family protein [Candidatus Eisenbacteria bacterium]